VLLLTFDDVVYARNDSIIQLNVPQPPSSTIGRYLSPLGKCLTTHPTGEVKKTGAGGRTSTAFSDKPQLTFDPRTKTPLTTPLTTDH